MRYTKKPVLLSWTPNMQELKAIGQKEPIVNDFFLYFSNKALAKKAASEIKKKGFEVRVDKIENEFLCQALKNIIFTDTSSMQDTVYEIEDILVEIAIKFQGRYDQWKSLGLAKGAKLTKLAKEFVKEPKKLKEPHGMINDTKKEEPSKMLDDTQEKKGKTIESSRLSGKMRLAIGISIFWFLFVYVVIMGEKGYIEWDLLFSWGIIPSIVIWIIAWVVKGFKREKNK